MATDSKPILMHKPNRAIPKKSTSLRPPLQINKSHNNKNAPIPKNIRRQAAPSLNKHQTKQAVCKQQEPNENIHDAMAKVLAIVIDQLQFEQGWARLMNAVGQYFKFKIIFPEPVHPLGLQLMKNGAFIVYWLKIIAKNTFICAPMVVKHAREKYLPEISMEKEYLEAYLHQITPPEQKKTPLRTNKPTESIKRSILKNSEKKVQFGKDEIIYPTLDSYVPQNARVASRQQRIAQIRNKHGYILDYLQINDVYLLDEVEIVGVIKEYDEMHAIIQIKQKQTAQERTCIALPTRDVVVTHPLMTLQRIEKDFENLGYLQLDGRNTSQIWIDSLPSQKARGCDLVRYSQ